MLTAPQRARPVGAAPEADAAGGKKDGRTKVTLPGDGPSSDEAAGRLDGWSTRVARARGAEAAERPSHAVESRKTQPTVGRGAASVSATAHVITADAAARTKIGADPTDGEAAKTSALALYEKTAVVAEVDGGGIATAAAAVTAPAIPPAHRWVRTAGSARGNRAGAASNNGPISASGAVAPDDTLARSIRDIIRQRSREERVAEARARGAKRKGDDTGEAAKRAAPGTSATASDAVDAGDTSIAAAEKLPSSDAGASGKSGPGAVSMTPQVLVVNGQIVINEKSLTVDAAAERATALSDFTRVEESGTKLNSCTYANYTKAEKWTREDTEFFFQALRQFGTDFSLIQRLFPGRSRRQIKKKYLMEDKMNPGRVEAAIKNLNPDTVLYQNLINVLQTPDTQTGAEEGIARTVLDSGSAAAVGALGTDSRGSGKETSRVREVQLLDRR